MELKDYAPRDCCRLVKYDEVYETLDMSYEEHQVSKQQQQQQQQQQQIGLTVYCLVLFLEHSVRTLDGWSETQLHTRPSDGD